MHDLILAHGGVDMSPDGDVLETLRLACRDASLVERPASAVAAGAAVLEDDPRFNAGYGSVLTAEGDVEVDAAVVEGHTGAYGAVAAVRGIRHPTAVAVEVLDSGAAAILCAEGAQWFARRRGHRPVDLRTPEQVAVWQASRDGGGGVSPFTGRAVAQPSETVGCIVINGGRAAAGTSTGGVCGKPSGRIGDSAILGAGLWADDSAAVLCSGEGEAMISLQIARRVGDLIRDGEDVAAVVGWGVTHVAQRRGATCAIVAVRLRDLSISAAHSGASFPVMAKNRDCDWVVEPHHLDGLL